MLTLASRRSCGGWGCGVASATRYELTRGGCSNAWLSPVRCFTTRPSCLLLDEPDTGLDQHAAAMLTDLLHEVGATRRTVLMTTHNLERGLELGDRVAILAGGRIAFQADKSDLDPGQFREIYYEHVDG